MTTNTHIVRANPAALLLLLLPLAFSPAGCQVVLMDSLKKRTTFLERAVAHLGEVGQQL